MPSKKSNCKYFSKAMFLQTVDSLLPIPIIYFLVIFLALPMNIFMLEEGTAQGDFYMLEFAQYVYYIQTYGISTTFLLGCLSALLVFRYLYLGKSANMVHALPIHRTSLFFTQYLAGLSFVIVPNILLVILTVIACLFQGFVFVTPLLYMFWVSSAMYFFFYSFAVFCAMFTGSPGAVAIFYLIFNFIVAFVTLLLDPVFDMYYLGYTGDILSYPFVQLLTPIYALVFGSKVYVGIEGIPDIAHYWDQVPLDVITKEDLIFSMAEIRILLAYVAVAVVMIGISWFVYRRRHLETAGEAVAVPAMKPVFRMCITVVGGISMGIVTLFLITESWESHLANLVLPLYSLVWGVVFAFVSDMILQKTFRVLKYWKNTILPVLAIGFVFLAMVMDFTGYESHIPQSNDVEMVVVDMPYVYPTDSVLNWGWTSTQGENFDTQFAQITNLHQEALASARTGFTGETNLSLRFRYHLQNGYITSRDYFLEVGEEEAVTQTFLALANDKAMQEHAYGFASAQEHGLISLSFEQLYDTKSDSFIMSDVSFLFPDATGSQVKEMEHDLLDAMAKDFEEGNLGIKFLDRTHPEIIEKGMYTMVVFQWNEISYEEATGLSATATETKPTAQGLSQSVTLENGVQTTQLRESYVAITQECVHTMAVVESWDLSEEYRIFSNLDAMTQFRDWYVSGSKGNREKVPFRYHYSDRDDLDLNDPMTYANSLY